MKRITTIEPLRNKLGYCFILLTPNPWGGGLPSTDGSVGDVEQSARTPQETFIGAPLEGEAKAQFMDWAQGGTSPHVVLAEFLQQLGATEPHRSAVALLREFGTAAAVLSGSRWRLKRTVGYKLASGIKAAREFLGAALLDTFRQGPVLSSREELMCFIQFSLGSLTRESLMAIYVDSNHRLLAVERIASGSISDVAVNINAILHRGLDVGAFAFFLVHNHPSGDSTPSETDVLVTERLGWIAKELDMPLIEHLVISHGALSSVVWA